MRFFKVIFGALLTILGIIFIINNLEVLQQKVQFKFDIYLHTFHSAPVTLWILILFVFFLGVLGRQWAFRLQVPKPLRFLRRWPFYFQKARLVTMRDW